MKPPPNIVYGLEQSPPAAVTALNAVQHVGLIAINLVYPMLVFRAAAISTPAMTALLAMGMIVLGIATFLQALRKGPIGSGYLCPATFTAAYVTPSLLAVKMGGLPLLFGMTIFAGMVEALLARFLNQLRAVFPAELSGLVIFMIGISAGVAGVRSLIGDHAEVVSPAEWVVALVTLATMISLNIWGRGVIRMLCALIGLVVGYGTAALLGLAQSAHFAGVHEAAWFALPHFENISWSFDLSLAAVFAIASLAAAMKALGTITVCQRMNDADWVRPDMRSASRGVLADGVSTMVAGAMGAVGTNTSTPSVGLASAIGVASRRVAYAVAALFIFLGLMPKLAAVLAVMPRSVMVAALLFAVCFIVVNGLQVMTSRLLDVRRTIVIGLSITGGIAIEVFPRIAAIAPSALTPAFGSALVFATVLALLLNLLFRLGVRKTAVMVVERQAMEPKKIEDFFRAQGGAWGARPEVIARAMFGVTQLIEVVVDNYWHAGPLHLEASFDEFNVDVRLVYEGSPLEFPDRRPSELEIIEFEDGPRRLAGFLLRHNADRVRSEVKNGRVAVLFHFDH